MRSLYENLQVRGNNKVRGERNMKKMINLTINDIPVSVEEGSTILSASVKAGVKIPTLCFLKETNEVGACRVCLVEVAGMRNLVASCVFPVSEGMQVYTNTPRVRESRKNTIELILSTHNQDCLSCSRNLNCELQALAKEYDCDTHKYDGEKPEAIVDNSSPCFKRDNSKCILCGKCVAVCASKQSVHAIGKIARGFKTQIGSAFKKPVCDSDCVNCGQCVINCPTGALIDVSQEKEVMNAIYNKDKRVVVAMAPATRVALGECFGNKIGENCEKKMVSALKRLGFDDVFDVNFAADLTIMEEGHEFIERVKAKKTGPMFTSCCPGWVKFVETFYPEFINNLSTCKSPQQMFGAICKTYYAEKLNMKPEDIYVVSIMPCIAKKFERLRDDQEAAGKGIKDVDAILTARELADLIKKSGIDFNNLDDADFDLPLGMSSGAGVIFGASGGVMEAALRTVADVLENKSLNKIDYLQVRGLQGTKEATLTVAGKELNIAVVSGLANARALMEEIKSGNKNYDFVEVMACPGGCINGGGMPIHPAHVINTTEIPKERAKGLYKSDEKNVIRKSHENKAVMELYKTYLGDFGGEKAHHLLHTSYVDRSKK